MPRPMTLRHRDRHQRGYALLATLAVLVLAAVVLSGMVRSSLARVVLARQAQEDLQRRWGVISCQRALLPHAEQILSKLEAEDGRPLASRQATIQLGRCAFRVVLADEQAKFNVNTALRHRRRSDVEQALREAFRGTGLSGHVRLQVPTEPNPWPVGSFAQILPEVPAQTLLAGGRGAVAPADVVTCWSDGKINILRASEASLTAALYPTLSGSQIAELLRARQQAMQPTATVVGSDTETSGQGPAQALAERQEAAFTRISQSLVRDAGSQDDIGQLLTSRSSCHSLWVIATEQPAPGGAASAEGGARAVTCQLFVLDTASRSHPMKWSLAW